MIRLLLLLLALVVACGGDAFDDGAPTTATAGQAGASIASAGHGGAPAAGASGMAGAPAGQAGQVGLAGAGQAGAGPPSGAGGLYAAGGGGLGGGPIEGGAAGAGPAGAGGDAGDGPGGQAGEGGKPDGGGGQGGELVAGGAAGAAGAPAQGGQAGDTSGCPVVPSGPMFTLDATVYSGNCMEPWGWQIEPEQPPARLVFSFDAFANLQPPAGWSLGAGPMQFSAKVTSNNCPCLGSGLLGCEIEVSSDFHTANPPGQGPALGHERIFFYGTVGLDGAITGSGQMELMEHPPNDCEGSYTVTGHTP